MILWSLGRRWTGTLAAEEPGFGWPAVGDGGLRWGRQYRVKTGPHP